MGDRHEPSAPASAHADPCGVENGVHDRPKKPLVMISIRAGGGARADADRRASTLKNAGICAVSIQLSRHQYR
jgi:hypothetical protein